MTSRSLKDKKYRRKFERVTDFSFNKETALVFEDMLRRSIPLYDEIQYMIGKISNYFSTDNTNIYDLGCSNGITLSTISRSIQNKKVRLIGVDSSRPMLEEAKQRFAKDRINPKPRLILADLNNPIKIQNASVVLLNLTLQFIRPLHRDQLISKIYQGMRENGCLILIEKVLGNSSDFNRMFIQFYYDRKRENQYTELEIAQKREALENVLIPYRTEENKKLLQRNGFSKIDLFFKWFNFSGMIAVK